MRERQPWPTPAAFRHQINSSVARCSKHDHALYIVWQRKCFRLSLCVGDPIQLHPRTILSRWKFRGDKSTPWRNFAAKASGGISGKLLPVGRIFHGETFLPSHRQPAVEFLSFSGLNLPWDRASYLAQRNSDIIQLTLALHAKGGTCNVGTNIDRFYTMSEKRCRYILPIALPNADRFSKFFHRQM